MEPKCECPTMCKCCPQYDIELKNAVAIQKNAAAIASLILSVQHLQEEIDKLKPDPEDSSES